MKKVIALVLEAGKLWYRKNASGMASTVSYYMLFAIAPLLLLTVFVTSMLYGKTLVVTTFYQWGKVLGPDMLALLRDAVQNLEGLTNGFTIPIVGLLFFSGMVIVMFNAFSSGLHILWDVPHRGIRGLPQKTLRSVIFVFVFELYLLCLIGFSVLLNNTAGTFGVFGMYIFQTVFFILATTILFSLAYGILPWESLPLKERALGALIASFLFYLAKSVVSWYVTATPIPGLFGTAGLILVLLIWVYISCAIVYYGAACAQVLLTRKITQERCLV